MSGLDSLSLHELASDEHILDVLSRQTTLDLPLSDPGVQKLVRGVRRRFLNLVRKGEAADDRTIIRALPKPKDLVLPCRGGKHRGRPGLGEKVARSRRDR